MSKLAPLFAVVSLCVACGGAFEAASQTAGVEDGGSAGARTVGNGGLNDGVGGDSVAGVGAGAGVAEGGSVETGEGGSGASAGADVAGNDAGGSGTSVGGSGSAGSGSGVGGSAVAGSGGSSGVDCTTLKEEYRVAVQKARTCDKGSSNQCSASSTLQPVGCGCPVLVNARSAATAVAKQKYQAIQDNHCEKGPICNIACLPYTAAECSSQSMTTSDVFMCTGSGGVATM